MLCCLGLRAELVELAESLQLAILGMWHHYSLLMVCDYSIDGGGGSWMHWTCPAQPTWGLDKKKKNVWVLTLGFVSLT